jgi:hypothetical protein
LINLAAPRVLGLGRFGNVIQLFLLATSVAISVILIIPRSRKALLGIGRALGLPHLDMNVEYQPNEGAFFRTLWIFSSAVTLTIQIPVYVLFVPFRLILGAILSFSRTNDASGQVPSTARFLLLLIPRKYRENLVGDLEEEFATIVFPQYGPRRAQLWYWEQVFAGLAPIAWAQVKRLAVLVFLWKAVKQRSWIEGHPSHAPTPGGCPTSDAERVTLEGALIFILRVGQPVCL